MKPLDGVNNERGAVVVIVAVALTMFIGFGALAVDVGYMMVARNELQNTADAAALAAAGHLGRIYSCGSPLPSDGSCPAPMTYAQQQAYNAGADATAIQGAATNVALQNRAAGKNIVIDAADISIGTWNSTASPKFSSTLSQPDAVRVTARRDGTANGPISTFFAKILGINTVNVSAMATAALTGESTMGPGGLPIPVGISKAWFTKPSSEWCNQPIKFYPTGTIDGCAGWNTYEETPPSASTLKKLLDDLAAGKYTSPETTAGVTHFQFTGGTAAAAFSNMQNLFNVMKVKNDGVLDNDTDSATWTTSVPVYDWPDCSNPNKNITIVGFSTVVITQVVDSPAKLIQAQVLCDNIESGRGGGGNYGNKGSIPGLVQ